MFGNQPIEILIQIFAYLDHELIKIRRLSKWFLNFYNSHGAMITYRIFQHYNLKIAFKDAFRVYESVIYNNYDLSTIMDSEYDDYDPNIVYKSIPFKDAIKKNHVDIINLVLNNAVDIKQYMFDAIRAAIFKGHLNIVKLLIENNYVGINELDLHDDAPLMSAAECNDFEIVQYLINNGANANIEGGEALVGAVYDEDCDIRIVKLLINNGVNVNARDDKPLETAIKNNRPDIVKLILDNRTAVVTNNCDHIKNATYCEYYEIVMLFLMDEHTDPFDAVEAIEFATNDYTFISRNNTSPDTINRKYVNFEQNPNITVESLEKRLLEITNKYYDTSELNTEKLVIKKILKKIKNLL